MSNKPRRILAVETAGRLGSVALGRDRELLAAATLSGNMKHTSELLPTIERLLQDQGWSADSLTDVFVSIGPGSFTGLRIGVTLARTLSWSIGVKVVAVPTLDAIALNALEAQPNPQNVAVILDAKRKQIYTAAFSLQDGAYQSTMGPELADPQKFLARCPRPLVVLGEGVDYHREAIDKTDVTVLDKKLWPGRAENVFRVGLELADAGQYTPGNELLPLYIRRPEAEEKWEKLHPPEN